jgi:hypothetical protein
LIGFWTIECAFCRNLSSQMPIETPHIHAVREQRSRFLLVVENLAERPGVLRHVNRGPHTLVHGGSHRVNFFVTPNGIGMLDFQGAHFGAGLRDVQYFMVNFMTVPDLPASERDLVQHYVEIISDLGAPIAFEVAWEQYRTFSFQTLMTAVVSLGLGSFTDSDEVMRVMLERSTAAVRRLDFEGWLAGQH